MTMLTIGTRSALISRRLRAIASACPCASASGPGQAPVVSTKVTIGLPNRSPRRMSRSALRKPSGMGIPARAPSTPQPRGSPVPGSPSEGSLRGFWWPTTMTDAIASK
jgi:hypothetical protein